MHQPGSMERIFGGTGRGPGMGGTLLGSSCEYLVAFYSAAPAVAGSSPAEHAVCSNRAATHRSFYASVSTI